MQIQLFNTLTRRKEPFTPLKKGEAGLYTCGPTVYNFQHIGNYRTYIFEDILKRTLTRAGFKVNHVMNITDVGHLTSDSDTGEDKMEVGAAREGKTAWDIAKFFTEAFLKDIDALNIQRSDTLCPATGHIPEQIAMVVKLEQNGLTYTIKDGVYFDTTKLPDYGKLDPNRHEGLKAGARVEVVEGKRSPADFALWKLTAPGTKRQMEWDSPWGKGFPGWHIECSAMAIKYLGETFDIHCGGVDHISIHHTNEIAQAEGANRKPFVKVWMHGEFLLMNEAKMAKSAGGFIRLPDLVVSGVEPLAYRLFTYSAHYRKHLDFSFAALQAAQKSLGTLREHADKLTPLPVGGVAEGRGGAAASLKAFDDALADDLNMPAALAEVWNVLRSKDITPEQQRAFLASADQVLGLGLLEKREEQPLSPVMKQLVEDREAARKAKDFARSDSIRKQLAEQGVLLEDTPQGPRWKVVNR